MTSEHSLAKPFYTNLNVMTPPLEVYAFKQRNRCCRVRMCHDCEHTLVLEQKILDPVGNILGRTGRSRHKTQLATSDDNRRSTNDNVLVIPTASCTPH